MNTTVNETLTLQWFPVLQRIIRRAAPGYRRRKVVVWHATEVTLHGGYWDGGSVSQWELVDYSGQATPLDYPTTPPQFGGGVPPTVELKPEGPAVLRTGTFRGKTATAWLYVHPDNVRRYVGEES